jgi:capsid protein
MVGGYNGDKFLGGFGETRISTPDYWELRYRSNHLFNENIYARGIIRRLITNEINTGLMLDSTPDGSILGIPDETLNDWSEGVETRFRLWGKSPSVCDFRKRDTLGALQRSARLEALVGGDVLVILRPSPTHKTPMVQLIGGDKVQSPLNQTVRKGHKIVHGVEIDKLGRHKAFWVRQEDGQIKRMPAVGEKTKRPIAWLLYGTDKRMDDVRGQPILSIMLQSLRDVDRYRDSALRKAVINSVVAMFIKKGENNLGSLPMQGGAVRTDTVTGTAGGTDAEPRTFNISKYIAGTIIDELQFGEEPVPMSSQGTDEKFGDFEGAMIAGLAWANEIPPEILTQAFSNNYSASQASINEFKIYLNKFWTNFGETFLSPIYVDWLISETLSNNIKADGLLEAWADQRKYDKFASYVSAEWYGSIKPSTDMVKATKASENLVANGWSTNAREARGLTGTSYAQNIKKLKRENELKVEALRPLAEFKAEFNMADNEGGLGDDVATGTDN